MIKDTRKMVRRMLGIDFEPERIIGARLEKRLDAMEEVLGRVSRQHGIRTSTLAVLIATVPEKDRTAAAPIAEPEKELVPA